MGSFAVGAGVRIKSSRLPERSGLVGAGKRVEEEGSKGTGLKNKTKQKTRVGGMARERRGATREEESR